MAITYPLTPPASPNPARLTPVHHDVVAASTSPFTLQSQMQAHQGQLRAAMVELPILDRAGAQQWAAFLLALKGRFGTFTMGYAGVTAPLGVATGTPLVNGAGQSGEALATKGDLLQVGSFLYSVLLDANSNVSGLVTLDIWPRLRASPADNAPITVANPTGLWRRASNEQSWVMEPGLLYSGFSFQVVEAL
jgi:hypothetical protein